MEEEEDIPQEYLEKERRYNERRRAQKKDKVYRNAKKYPKTAEGKRLHKLWKERKRLSALNAEQSRKWHNEMVQRWEALNPKICYHG